VNIILFGPPGAGKGTQTDNIAKNFNLNKISTGDLLRKEIIKKSNLGLEIKETIEKGFLASDSIINNLIKNILANKVFFNRLIFDGYPRNLNQAKNLDIEIKKTNQKISCVFSLNVKKELLIKRIIGRETCSNCGLVFNKFFNPPNQKNHSCESKFLQKRSDDNEEILNSRYDTYLKETLPILNFYREQKLLHEIDGTRKIDQIYEEIRGIITSLET